MVVCPECNEQVPHSATKCPRCGANVIRGDQLEDISTRTTGWQKIVIIITTILLIAIAFTFYGAESRENAAAQNKFSGPVAQMISNVAAQTGVGHNFGIPAFKLDAKTKGAELMVVFPHGPLSQEQAATYGQSVCAGLAQAYVRYGYMPRHISVTVGSSTPQGIRLYGKAVYNGNIDALGWEAAPQ